MSLIEQLADDVKTALRAHDSRRVSTLRLAIAAVKKAEIDARGGSNHSSGASHDSGHSAAYLTGTIINAAGTTPLSALNALNASSGASVTDSTSDTAVLAILEKQCKQRRESIAQFEQAQRPEAAAQEQAELDILLSYLPKPADDLEVQRLIAQALEETGAHSAKNMGAVMALLKVRLAGRVDMAAVSQRVKALLQP